MAAPFFMIGDVKVPITGGIRLVGARATAQPASASEPYLVDVGGASSDGLGGGLAEHAPSHQSGGDDEVDIAQLVGTLAVGHGGLGLTTLPSGSIPYASSLDHVAALTIGAAGKMMRSNGAAPAWSGWTAPTGFSAGSIPYASSLDTLAALAAPVAASVLTHNATIPVWVSALAKAQQHSATAYTDVANVYTSSPTAPNLILNQAAGNNRQILYRTSGVDRWYARADSAAETGGNAGTNYSFIALNDAGSIIGTALALTRATLAASFGGALSSVGVFNAAADTDSTHALGRARVFSSVSDNAMLAHFDRASSTAYALRQTAAGATWVNAITGQIITLAVNDSEVARVTATGLSTPFAITSTLAMGTAPFAIASTTRVSNLNAELWDGIGRGTTGQVLLAVTGAASAYGQITNAHILGAAGIAWSKLSFTGSSLADLGTRSAADLATGTLPDARLSSNVALLHGAGRFTGAVSGTGASGVRVGTVGGLGGFVIDTGVGADGWSVFGDSVDLHFEHDSGLALLLSADGLGGGSFSGMTFVDVTSAYKANGNQVVGARKTGWATATGTATRTTFDTATVTLVQLAQRVKALLDDLHSTAGHGLLTT